MPTECILIVGGAGYIGSHMVKYLIQKGHRPIVLDNLSTGHKQSVKNAELVIGDIQDRTLLNHVFSSYPITAVMHFASFIQVGESVRDPYKYYQNNFSATLDLLRAMLDHGVKKFIFSSSAAVYGEPRYTPIDENHPLLPINPYGKTKYMVEQMLDDFSKAYDFSYISLRYFNAAGADPEGDLCECHEPESHLIPLILQVAKNELEAITINGQDYSTADGTCIRDYIHVSDLCSAHFLALNALMNQADSHVYNLGTGKGASINEVITVARKITQHTIPVVYSERRLGDPAVLVADAKRARKELGWNPLYSDLETIIQHAWNSICHEQ